MCDNIIQMVQNSKSMKEWNRSYEVSSYILENNIKHTGYETPFVNEFVMETFIRKKLVDEDRMIREATYELSADVDYVFAEVKTFLEDFEKNSKIYTDKFKKQNIIPKFVCTSNNLPSDLSKQAHEIKPIQIIIGRAPEGENSYYDPSLKRIFINVIPYKVIETLIEHDMSFDELDKHTKEKFHKFSKVQSRQAIIHEIAHWIDDSLNNNHITKYLKKAIDSSKTRNEISKEALETDIEIQSYTHSVKQYKDDLGEKKWNVLTFKQLFDDTALGVVIDELREDPVALKKWKRKLFKRLAREDLIGNNMDSLELKDL
jgi:hypothetical protein